MRRIVTAIAALAIGLALSGPLMAEELTIVGTGDGVNPKGYWSGL